MPRIRGFQWNNRTKQLFSKGKEVVDNSASNLVNALKNVGSATGAAVQLTANGDDTNIDLTLSAKGTGSVTVSSTGAIIVPKGTTAQAPTGAAGMLRYNTTLTRYERYDTSGWTAITTTSSTSYLTTLCFSFLTLCFSLCTEF